MNEQQQREAERRDNANTLQRARDREQLLLQLQAATSGGRHREENVELFAHCGNVLTCTDKQIPVQGARVTTSQTYADNGGDDGPLAHMVERSWTDLEFANEEDKTCKRCGGPTFLSDQLRPIYAPLSGHDQRGLVELAKKLIVAGVKPTPEAILASSKPPEDDRVSQLEHELAELKALVGGNGHAESPVDPPAAAPARQVKGYRKRGEGRYEGLLYRTETEDGKQHSLGTFDTPEAAVAAREAALSEATS